MRLYRVENINKVFDKPVKVYAETAREAIKKAFGIENVRQDRYGNIVVCGVCNKREDNPRVMRWVYKEVNDGSLREIETYKQEYRLAAAANKQLADALDKAREENKMLRLQIFAFVRNSAVLPVGIRLCKSEQEITDKTFETIEAAKNMIDVEAVKAAMNLATKRENRFNNAD